MRVFISATKTILFSRIFNVVCHVPWTRLSQQDVNESGVLYMLLDYLRVFDAIGRFLLRWSTVLCTKSTMKDVAKKKKKL